MALGSCVYKIVNTYITESAIQAAASCMVISIFGLLILDRASLAIITRSARASGLCAYSQGMDKPPKFHTVQFGKQVKE